MTKSIFVLFQILLLLSLSSCYFFEPDTFVETSKILKIENYLGNYQNIHPKVLYFEEGWNGYKFWMSYTPYPKGETKAENPCIAVSQDGIHWFTPQGLTNPIEKSPALGYNSDPHLVYDEQNDILELWWRPFNSDMKEASICRKKSSDGIHWSSTEDVTPENMHTQGLLSPAVWIENDVYYMVYSNGKVLNIMYGKSIDNHFEWSQPEMLNINWEGLYAWHHDIIKDKDGNLEIVVCAFTLGNDNNSADLFYIKMNDDFSSSTIPELILARSDSKHDFHHKSIYRSSLVKVDDIYHLYVSAIDDNNNRWMGLAKGLSPQSMIFEKFGESYNK